VHALMECKGSRSIYARAMSSHRNPLMPASITTFTGSVFHYTSSAGLLGSLESRTILASAASSLNDLGEVRQGWEMIKNVLAALSGSDSAKMLRRFADDPVKSEHEVFVLSASTDGDDANQWRLYADGGRGYAIELDGVIPLAAVSGVPDALPAAAQPKFGSFAKNIAAVSPWQKVLYRKSDVETALKELLVAVDNEVRQIEATANMPEDAIDAAYDSVQDWAYEALSTIAHLIKSPGFSGENEVRVVATFGWGEEHIRYRSSANGIVGYATLAEAPGGATLTVLRPSAAGLPIVTSLPVKSIRLGPLLRPEHENTMTAFLRAKDLRHVGILTSTVPLR